MSAGVSLVVAVYLLRDVLFSLCVFEVLHFSRLLSKIPMGKLIPLEMGLNECNPLLLAYRARFDILGG